MPARIHLVFYAFAVVFLVSCAAAPTSAPASTAAPQQPAASVAPTSVEKAQLTPVSPTAVVPTQAPEPAQALPTEDASGPQPLDPASVVDDQGRLVFSRVADLSKLSTYRAEHTWRYDWDRDDQDGETTVQDEYIQEPYAERVVILRGDGSGGRQELIRHEGVTYMLGSDGWQSIRSSSALFPPEADPRVGLLPFVAGATGELVGQEELDGRSVDHYHYGQDVLALGGFYTDTKEAYADVWVAPDLSVYVKARLFWSGGTSDRGEGTFEVETTVTGINEPLEILPPEGVEPPQVPEDIVLMRDATEVALVDKAIYYQTNAAPYSVADYYLFKMPANGWSLVRDSRDEPPKDPNATPIPEGLQTVLMTFRKDNRELRMSVQPGPPNLVVMVVATIE